MKSFFLNIERIKIGFSERMLIYYIYVRNISNGKVVSLQFFFHELCRFYSLTKGLKLFINK